MKTQISIAELADEIVRFDKAEDFNLLYQDDDSVNLNAFSRTATCQFGTN